MRPTHKNRSRNRHRPTGSSGGGGSNSSGGNPLTRVYESNGPDVKVRGNAQTIAEKYLQLGRDAQSSSDIVMAESYFQHAEHYLRIISAAQAFNQQNQPQQFRRQDEEFDDEDGEEGSDSQGNDMRGQQQAEADGMGDQPGFEAERQQPQPQQHNQQNYRQQRDNRDQQGRDQNRDQGRDQNRDQNRDQPRDQNRDQAREQSRDNNGQPYQPRERFNKPRWQDRRDQNIQGQNPQAQQGGEPRQNNQYQSQPPRNEEQPRIVEAVTSVPQPAVAAPVAVEAQWEAPSFLMRPAPTPPADRAPEAPAASEVAAPAPAKRKYERKPRKEAAAETPPVTEPVSE